MKIRTAKDADCIDTDDIEPGQCFRLEDDPDSLYLRLDDEDGSLHFDEERATIQAVDLENGYCWRRELDEGRRRARIVKAEVGTSE